MAHTLATTSAAADRDFPTLGALARHLLTLAGAAELAVGPCMISRGELPGGACLAVRALTGAHGGRGQLIAYAFLETPSHGVPPDMGAALRAALVAHRANAGAVSRQAKSHEDKANAVRPHRDEASAEEPGRMETAHA